MVFNFLQELEQFAIVSHEKGIVEAELNHFKEELVRVKIDLNEAIELLESSK